MKKNTIKNIIGIVIIIVGGWYLYSLMHNESVLRTRTYTQDVEVEPDKFITLQRHDLIWDLKHGSFFAVHVFPIKNSEFYQKDTFYIIIPWDEKIVSWVGVGTPISIRSNDGKLYAIVFDRETNFSRIKLRYYEQRDNILVEIDPKNYPKNIATQNMWLKRNNGSEDEVETALKMSPDSHRFCMSLTAKIWLQLETGQEYYTNKDDEVSPEFLTEYQQKYNVIKLNSILKPDTNQ